jgi:2-amino-1-hydroxyethylphosphonate dioxygenase (glycine-forming)
MRARLARVPRPTKLVRTSSSLDVRAASVLGPLCAASVRGYIGEPVSQLEHALQCAFLARRAGANGAEVLAGLLHDIGHLVGGDDAPQMAGLGVLEHESIGARFLSELGVAPLVCSLVSGHVAAKRYLARRKTGYRGALSEASRGTLAFQGGPMTEAEACAFEADPACSAKLRLRVWDEAAKRPDLDVPGLTSYVPLLREHMEP